MSFWDEIHRISRLADEQLKRVSFVPTEMPAWIHEEGLKAYNVVIGNKKAGRLRYGDKYPKRWRYEGIGARLYYDTRKTATHVLIEEHIRKTEQKT